MKSDQRLPVYLLAAPVGEQVTDISYGVLKLLGQLDVIMVENTETDSPDDLFAKLRAKNVIKAGARIVPLSEYADKRPSLAVVDECVAAGIPFGIMADSGICCFIDPGLDVVRHIIENHADAVELVPVGASSAMDAAIMMSGVDCTNFVFMGHFPETCRWFDAEIRAGVPGIAYVRGDSLNAFIDGAAMKFSDKGDTLVSVFKNIRVMARRAQKRFRLADASDFMDELAGGDRASGGGFSDNFVAMLHMPQDK